MDKSDKSNIGIAFAAVIAAGASTGFGAAIVFFPRLVKLAAPRVLASSLGISAGVMAYVAFIEMFQKSILEFKAMNRDTVEDEGERLGRARLNATLSFFFGVFLLLAIDIAIKRLSRSENNSHTDIHDASAAIAASGALTVSRRLSNRSIMSTAGSTNEHEQHNNISLGCPCCRPDPVGDLEEWHRKAAEEEQKLERVKGVRNGLRDKGIRNGATFRNSDSSLNESGSRHTNSNDRRRSSGLHQSNSGNDDSQPLRSRSSRPSLASTTENDSSSRNLLQIGLKTAAAISLHNFPEGLATYVAVLDDPTIGGVLAFAIGLHNIPEGVCVALPVYYATGDRWKAFWIGSMSGITEPIGAILGYIILSRTFSEMAYGFMYGIVAGMMVMIALKEHIPTAYKYDPKDTVVTISIFSGMAIMALSLVLLYL